MSETISLTSSAAGRYAAALFTLCKEQSLLKSLQKDVEQLSDWLDKSKDFRFLIASPIYKREQQELAISALAKHFKVMQHTESLLCLLARKGRIFMVPDLIKVITMLIKSERNEIGVEVVSASTLTKSQITQLEKKISELSKKKARIEFQTDKSLIGGMIIKLGSKMIDTTIKSKLMKLQNSMKEVN